MWARPAEVVLAEIETCLQRKVTLSLLKRAPDFSFKSVSPRHLRLYYFTFASNCFFTSLSRTCSNIGKINGAEKTLFLSGVRKSPTYIITNRRKAIQYLIAGTRDTEESMLTVHLPLRNSDLPGFPRLSSHSHVFLSLDLEFVSLCMLLCTTMGFIS